MGRLSQILCACSFLLVLRLSTADWYSNYYLRGYDSDVSPYRFSFVGAIPAYNSHTTVGRYIYPSHGFDGFDNGIDFSDGFGYNNLYGYNGGYINPYSHLSGYRGYQGYNGLSGYQGYNGLSGYQGYNGLSGYHPYGLLYDEDNYFGRFRF